MNTDTLPAPSLRAPRNAVLRLFASIWFGVALLTLILVYCVVFSALPRLRWTLELTEMQAFQHWVFVALIVLLMLSLAASVLLRVRWVAINAGAITAHVGLLLLIGGSIAYFGGKVEGSVLLQAPRVEVRYDDGTQQGVIAEIPAVAGETWARRVPHREEPVWIEIAGGENLARPPAASAAVSVRFGDEQPETLTLEARDSSWQPIDDAMALRLVTFAPQNAFYDNDLPALYFRDMGGDTRLMSPVHGLPIYYDRYVPGEQLLLDSNADPVPPQRPRPQVSVFGVTIPTSWFERWRLPIDVPTEGLPFDVRITGYASYVVGMQPRMDEQGRFQSWPVLAPREQRRVGVAPRAMSAIQLEITGRGAHAGYAETQWIRFSIYPDLDTYPLEVALPDGETWQLVYSRARHDLGAAVAAQRLHVTYFPGRRGIESYHSEISVLQDGAVRDATVETNHTYTVGRWTLYQSGFAEDHWSYSILGVGNRPGMWPMNIGWVLVTLGCLYAFYVKPVLMRRARNRLAGGGIAVALLALLVVPGCGEAEPYAASQQAARMDTALDWGEAALLVVQDGGRYKTLDSFARESFSAMTGSEHLPGLSPAASLFEWLFNRDAYQDTPLIKVRNAGLRGILARQLTEEKRQRVLDNKRLTPREMQTPGIEQALRAMQSDPTKRRAVNRVRAAMAYAERMQEFIAFVPHPGGDEVDPWYTPMRVLGNLSDGQLAELGITRDQLPPGSRQPVPGVTSDQALDVVVAWSSMRDTWRQGDAAAFQKYLGELTALLPAMAPPDVYPSRSQREAEARYYAAGKFTYGWIFYFLALLTGVIALVTRWRWPWVTTIILLLPALGVHGYGLALRWYILGRIPVANMFEAVVASAAIGVGLVLLFELFLRTRVLLVGAAALGFMFLVAGQFMLPGAELGTIPGILDDIQLRLHTVMIISAYALIFLAAVVATIYLLGYVWLALTGKLHVGDGAAGADTDLAVSRERPILAGAMPGDEVGRSALPAWLNNIDWAHLIILNIVFVLLFVGGIILGAWWADYSWGRPWGWDPKEVFALNTWLVYAILIHLRFVTRNRGLWTAVLSIIGCIMMMLNWFWVNFQLASMHSYV